MGLLQRLATSATLVAFVATGCSGGADTEGGDDASPAIQTPTGEELVETSPPTPTPTPPPDNAIQVGVLLDVGNRDPAVLDAGNLMSPLDLPAAIAFEAAISAINDSGGVLGRPVSIEVVDTTSRLSVIDKAAAEMIDDGVDLLVVTCELDFARPAIDRAAPADVLVISPCASEPDWSTGEVGALAFSMVPSADVYGSLMADYAWEAGFRDVTILADATAPEARVECDGFETRWSELGGTVAFRQGFNLRSAQALAEDPDADRLVAVDAAVLCAFPTIGLELIIGARRLGLEAPILASPSLDSGTWLPIDVTDASGGAAAIGDFRMFTLASVWGDDPSPALVDAINGYIALQATTPSSGRFVVGADLADLWAAAVESASATDGMLVAEELRGFSNVETVSGTVSFDGQQAPSRRQLRVMRHDNGALVFERLVG